MKKTSGAIPGPVDDEPTAPPTPAASAAPSTPSGLSGLHPGDARHMIAAIRRSSGRSSGSQASLPVCVCVFGLLASMDVCTHLGRDLMLNEELEGVPAPQAHPQPSPLAGRSERAHRESWGQHPWSECRSKCDGKGWACRPKEATPTTRKEEEDNGPAGGPVFPEVQRLLYRATDFLSSPVTPSRLPAQGRQHQASGARDETPAATSSPMPTPPPGSHPPAPRPSAPSPAARLLKIVIKGHRAGPAATDRPAAAENQPPPGRKTVPSGDGEAVAAAGEERAATAQGPKRPTKIKVVSRPWSSLAPHRAGNGNSGGGDEEVVEEADKPAPSHGEPGGASVAARTGAAKVGRPRGKKGASALAPPLFGAPQHQNQTLGLGEPGAAAGNTNAPAPKPKRKPRAKKDAPPPAASPRPPPRAAPQSRPRKPKADEAHLNVLGGLVGGALVQPNQGNNGPSQGLSDQSSLDHRLADPDADNLPGELPEGPHQADPGPEQLDAAPIDSALDAPVPYIPLDPIPTPGTGPCDPCDLRFEPDSTLPEVVHEDIQALARDGTLFARTLESVHWAHTALDSCGYDFDSDPLRAPIPRAVRAALAGYRPFVFPRTGANPFMGADVPRFGAVAAVPMGVVYGGGQCRNGMERGDPADASMLGDGVVLGWVLPRTIRYGSVFSRMENVLLIPAEWREGVAPRDEVGMGVEGAEKVRGEPGAVAAAASPIEEMPLEGPAYIDLSNDLDDDLYGNSQAGDIAEERRELEPEEDAAMDFDHLTESEAAPQLATGIERTNDAATGMDESLNEGMGLEGQAYAELGGEPEDDLYANNQAGDITQDQRAPWPENSTAMDVDDTIYPGAVPQPANIPDRTRGPGNNLGNDQPGDFTRGQQVFERNGDIARGGGHPRYPRAVPQPAIGGDGGNNRFGFGASEQRQFGWNGPDDNAMLGQPIGLTQADMDATVPGRPNLAAPGYDPNNLYQQPAALDDHSIISGGQAAVVEGQPTALNQHPAAFHDNYPVPNYQAMAAEGYPANLNEQAAASQYGFYNFDGETAPTEDQPAPWNEQPVARNNNFLIEHGQAARIEGQPAISNEHPVVLGHDHFAFNARMQAANAEAQPPVLNEQPAAWNDHLVIENGQAAVIARPPSPLHYNLLGLIDPAAAVEAAAMQGDPGGMNYEFFDPNRGAAIRNRPGVMNYDFFDSNQAATIQGQPELAQFERASYLLWKDITEIPGPTLS
ncbi:predicted protein [Chaetomium globosum CBS 148.51]|uniref:Uncharacterized protein n=1 Tax=Chaetomium globosum (strain ATCC 6205 / CBS 148.51 / DSM 1962 / NBRC 6347 / NRRL 1970) TaxID=306901 RepID=Q2GUF8_CHAGB|nr:uncharacterized protein CHGG_08396 [Chaetomium globosum CBS 148.51]EAQ84382.1 predicted protein [Chaetomium globosum CBS 148.51]